MVFLLLFSYVVLCDFFPLYEFRPNKCLSGSEENTYPDPLDDPIIERSMINFTRTNSSKTSNQTFEYGLRRHSRPATTEIVLTIWVFTLFCEEIRQVNMKILILSFQRTF
jgi:hypothetical protein